MLLLDWFLNALLVLMQAAIMLQAGGVERAGNICAHSVEAARHRLQVPAHTRQELGRGSMGFRVLKLLHDRSHLVRGGILFLLLLDARRGATEFVLLRVQIVLGHDARDLLKVVQNLLSWVQT
mgnify:CR=1 FL=1